MSMTAITAFQLIGIFCAYFLVVILLPHFTVGKTIRFRNRYERFMLYTMLGNFYVINLVYLLELLHISCGFTLILFTVVPCAFIKIKLERIPFAEKVSRWWDNLRRFTGGQLKLKAYRDATKDEREDRRNIRRARFVDAYVVNWVDVGLVLLLFVAMFRTVGLQLFESYGYKASDMVVHTYWVNSLCENDIFVRGVYPYGFHNMAYYLHAVFGFDIYVLMRLMALLSYCWVTLMLFCTLKLVCKSKYLPYLGAFLYSFFDMFELGTYYRYEASLPQEYGIMFILPTIYCAFEYFKTQRREKHGDASKRPYVYLGGFVVSFSLSFTVHFYGTMVVGLYIIGIIVGFLGWFIKRPYFKRLVFTGVIALLVSILPLGAALATGTRMEGSLRWGLSIILGAPSQEETNSESEENPEGEPEIDEEPEVVAPSWINQATIDKYGKTLGTFLCFLDANNTYIDTFVVKNGPVRISILCIPIYFIMILLGAILLVRRKNDRIYGSILVSTGVFMLMMSVMLVASLVGIPQLMDSGRTSIYYAYCLCFTLALFVDGVVFTCTFYFYKPFVRNAVSLILVLLSLIFAGIFDFIRDPLQKEGAEMDEAIECLTRIIRDDKDQMWTICSANDESRMVYGHGYHYEMIDFLREMDVLGSHGNIRIPTPNVYFFIEKIPMDYYGSYEGSGSHVSEEAAEKNLPMGRSLGIYECENRLICMSRLYYWAQKFMELYPNETSVYFENERFICIKVMQNPYRLFNFAIDYGFNVHEGTMIVTGD